MEFSISRIRVGWLALCFIGLVSTSCALSSSQSDVVIITATFSSPPTPTLVLFNQDQPLPAPTQTQAAPRPQPTSVREYVIQPGDTLYAVAAQFELSVDDILAANSITDPNLLTVGQVINLPNIPEIQGSDFIIIPDNRLVRAPGSAGFDVSGFVASQTGYIRQASDEVDGETFTAAEIVQRVAVEYSVDPRLLLTLLEYKGHWLSQATLDQYPIDYPLGAPASPAGFDRKGLYRQLTWAADNLNRAYYGWQENTISSVQTADDQRIRFLPSLNPATAGVQYLLGLTADAATWAQQVGVDGLQAVYRRLFGDPFENRQEPVVPPNLTQPALTLPFPKGEIWYFTGGPHGGWGTGSAWAAIDFAPPDDLTSKTSSCYVSDYFVTAAADGVIARSGEGAVVLDLDGDGDETTGWTILYLHMATQDRVPYGTHVRAGDRIGRPSCEGGVSNGTHAHIARRYNGEWIPVNCTSCRPEYARPTLKLGDWTFVGLPGQEYQGYMAHGDDQRVAEQGRNVANNEISW